MNTCPEIRKSVGLWLDGELPAERAEAVRLHVESCAACAEERRQLEKLNGAMQSLLASEAAGLDPGSFWRSVRQAVETKSASARYKSWLDRGPAWRAPSFAWTVPAVLALLIGALYFDVFTRPWGRDVTRNGFATVESIDAYGRNVALWRENESKTTVIWIYQAPESEDEGVGEAPDKGPAF
jgi:anti-sigma factor RsiW